MERFINTAIIIALIVLIGDIYFLIKSSRIIREEAGKAGINKEIYY